jgi:hypothetical protein
MIFDIINSHPVVTPEALYSIPEFKIIWDRDASDDKIRAQKEFAYIYHMGDSKSIYANISALERKETIIEDLFDGKFVEDKEIQEALKKYKFLRETPAMRLLNSSIKACDKLSGYFDDVDFLLRDANGKPLFTAKDVAMNLEKVGNIRESLIKLEQAVNKEQETAPKIRKGVTPGMFDV